MTRDKNTEKLHEIHSEPLRAYPHIIHTLSFHAAVKLIKLQLKARGEKLVEYSLKDLTILADAYFEAHREELIAATIVKVRSAPDLRSLAEKEARRRGRMWPLEPKADGPPKIRKMVFGEEHMALADEANLAATWQGLIDRDK